MTGFLQRGLFFAAFLLLIAAPALGQVKEPPDDDPIVYDLVFPVAGPHGDDYDTFGDCRGAECDREHLGNDIMADKLIPVVAAADGLVTKVRGIDEDGNPLEGDHQWLVVDHDGWQTRYLHLNNDTEGTDDGVGFGVTDEIISAWVAAGGDDHGSEFSYPVSAGQLIGWVGDSGNAEWSGSHLHFELRVGEGWDAEAIDPHPSLLEATHTTVPTWEGHFSDDDDSVHAASIDALADEGITKGCNPPENTRYCPGRHMTRGQVAAFIRRTLDLPPSETNYFTDDDETVFDGDINAVVEAGIGFECAQGAYCPHQPLLRDEMAEMLVRAFAAGDEERYSNPEDEDFFGDDDGNRFEESIDRLMAADVTRGCNPPDNDRYCPGEPLSRAQMASFFLRALRD